MWGSRPPEQGDTGGREMLVEPLSASLDRKVLDSVDWTVVSTLVDTALWVSGPYSDEVQEGTPGDRSRDGRAPCVVHKLVSDHLLSVGLYCSCWTRLPDAV